MVIVDANVLLYAVDRESAHHEPSLTWLDSSLSGTQTVGLAWVALLAFIRIATNPAIFGSPLAATDALDQVESWLGAPASTAVEPSARHPQTLRALLARAGTAGNLTTDAHLAALAIEYDAAIV